MLTRRELLKLSAMAGAAVALPGGPMIGGAIAKNGVDPSPSYPAFRQALPIQTPMAPNYRTAAADTYQLCHMPAEVQVLSGGPPTRMVTFNEQFPGPLIVAKRNRAVVLEQDNELPFPTSIHQHGAYADGDSDGHPDDLVATGGKVRLSYPNRFEFVEAGRSAGRTMWYHDHAIHHTGANVYRGLAGFFILRDPLEDALGLPRGRYDVPIVIQDRIFDRRNQLVYPVDDDDHSHNGVLGDVILVNGVQQPYMRVERRKYRLRFLNGSNGRRYELRLSNGAPLTVIATEGGLLEAPVRTSSLIIAQAERYDVVIDFAAYPAGTQIVLRNLAAESSRVAQVMRFDVAGGPVTDTSRVPDRFFPIQRIPTSAVTRRRHFEFGRSGGYWTINDRIYSGRRVDARVRVGDVEVWTMENKSGGWMHPIHLHLLNFQILSRNGRAPRPYERGWKEVVSLGYGETAQIIMKWPRVPAAGPEATPTRGFRNRYVFHCHNLEHEDHDMMTQFEVVA